jgi:iron complex outermembrane recepter protein
MSKRYSILTPLLAAATFSGSPATLSAENPRLEEIIVTANFRDTALMETVGSVSVIPESTITDRAAQHLEDILNAVPNVTWASGASRSRFVQIRGIGDLEQYYDPKYYPSVGMRLDNLELGDSVNAGMLFDVSQVEVLRGPQGTRYGSSGHAGMINIISNAPTESFEGQLSGGVGNYDSYNAGLVVSGPLHDTLRGRLAVQQNNSDGYIENENLDKHDTNDFDEFTSRGRLQWSPTETSMYELGVLYFDADNGHDPWSIENERTTWSDEPGHDQQETFAVDTSGNWLLSDTLRLEATVSYIDMKLHQSYDADWVSDEFCEIFTCSGGHETAQEIFKRNRERLVADVRLLGGENTLSAGEGNYVIGLYANDGSENYDYRFPSLWYGDFSSNSDYDTTRYAIYGEYEYAVSSQLTLVAGARLERFEDDYSDSNGFNSDNNDNLWNAKLSARYQLDDNTMVYATIARSAKPGGVNTSATANQPFMSPVFQDFTQGKLSFDDESLLNTEIGIKTLQFDQRLALSAAVFYTDRSNAQLENWMWDDAAGLWIGYLDSTSDAHNYGLEVESSFVLNDYFELFANIGLLHAEVDTIEAFDLDEFQFVSKDNRDQAKSPKYQYNVGTRVTINDQWSGHIEVEGRGDSYYGYYHDGKLDSYDLLNASLHWQRDAIGVTVWGRNLTDKDFAVHGLYFGNDPRDDYGAYQNETYTQLGEPRTYGIEFTYAF